MDIKNSKREVLGIHFGQFGVHTGAVTWDVLCKKCNFHGAFEGRFAGMVELNDTNASQIQTQFIERSEGVFRPRAIFLDLDDEPINNLQNGYLKYLFDPDNNFGCLNTSGCNNYARGCYGRDSKKLLARAGELLRYQVEETDFLYAIYHVNALEGGTGSGFTAAFVNRFLDKAGKYSILAHQLFPSETVSTSTNSTYNAVLGYSNIESSINFNACYNNEALYQRCYNGLSSPTYKDLNALVAPLIVESVNDIWSELTNAVPFPALNQLIPAFNPCTANSDDQRIKPSPHTVTMNIIKPVSALFSFPILNGKLLTSLFVYCMDNVNKNHIPAIHQLKKENQDIFVPWSPTFKVLHSSRTYFPDTSVFVQNDISLAAFFNSTSFRHALKKLAGDFDLLFGFESFMFWYRSLGMDDGQFKEARQHLQHIYDAYKLTELSTE